MPKKAVRSRRGGAAGPPVIPKRPTLEAQAAAGVKRPPPPQPPRQQLSSAAKQQLQKLQATAAVAPAFQKTPSQRDVTLMLVAEELYTSLDRRLTMISRGINDLKDRGLLAGPLLARIIQFRDQAYSSLTEAQGQVDRKYVHGDIRTTNSPKAEVTFVWLPFQTAIESVAAFERAYRLAKRYLLSPDYDREMETYCTGAKETDANKCLPGCKWQQFKWYQRIFGRSDKATGSCQYVKDDNSLAPIYRQRMEFQNAAEDEERCPTHYNVDDQTCTARVRKAKDSSVPSTDSTGRSA